LEKPALSFQACNYCDSSVLLAVLPEKHPLAQYMEFLICLNVNASSYLRLN
jgi:hypothetical protein